MKDGVDDGEVELSDHVLLSNSDQPSCFQSQVDSFVDEFLKNTRTCTHTHTCNPPGPDATHTHTCYHTHTQVITSEEEDEHTNDKEHSNTKAKRPSGNREAVRKYREKKKAHTAYLEEEVKKLRLVNQQLVRKLQGQAILEAEVLRLRSIFVDLRGKIDNELGSFPYQNHCSGATIAKEGDCALQSDGTAFGLQCQTDLPCFHSQPRTLLQPTTVDGNGKVILPLEGNCQSGVVDCQVNTNDLPSVEQNLMDTTETLVLSSSKPQ